MTDTTKTEALRLADLLEAAADNADMGRPKDKRSANRRAAAELRRLSAVEGKVQVMLDASNTVLAAVQAQRDRLAAECEALRAFVTRVAEQKPEKPDYWSSCGQCDHNISDAQDLIDAAMGGKESQGGNASGRESRP